MSKARMDMIIVERSIVIMARTYRSKWRKIHCVGCSKWKRRKDGSCKHERTLLEALAPKLKPLTRIVPKEQI